MAHNFRKVGDYYVSQIYGSDANSGLTPDLPKATLQAGLNLITATGKTLIVGAGVYKETISRLVNFTNSAAILADGKVVLDGNGNVNSFILGSSTAAAQNWSLTGFEFRNFLNITASTSGTNTTCRIDLNDCVIINSNLTKGVGNTASTTSIHTNCKFINCTRSNGTGAGQYDVTLDKCILINTIFNISASGTYRILTVTNSYSDSSSVFPSTTTGVDYNNIQGGTGAAAATTVTTGTYQDWIGRYYDLTLAGTGGSGTIGDPFYRGNTANSLFFVAEYKILYPTVNQNSFSADPKFNNVANLNFSLQSSSPHIKRASDGTNIGGTEYAKRMAATYDNVSLTNLEFSGNDLVVSSGFSNGTAVFEPFFIQWPLVRPLEKILYEGLLAFNKAQTPGGSQNQMVPDSLTYTTGAGANPDRLSVQFRFNSDEDEPLVSGDWDNGGYAAAGDYIDYEIDSKPQIDGAGKGNGHPDFNGAGSVFDLIPAWVQVKIILRYDDYV